MAACWDFVLGILTLRTKGLMLPYLVHVCADATIGCLAFFVLA